MSSTEFGRKVTEMAFEVDANWAPLEANLPPKLCAEFMWMFRKDGIEYFKHVDTRAYLRLDSLGRCFVQADDGLKEVPFEECWQRVSGRAGGIDDCI